MHYVCGYILYINFEKWSNHIYRYDHRHSSTVTRMYRLMSFRKVARCMDPYLSVGCFTSVAMCHGVNTWQCEKSLLSVARGSAAMTTGKRNVSGSIKLTNISIPVCFTYLGISIDNSLVKQFIRIQRSINISCSSASYDPNSLEFKIRPIALK